MRGICDASSVKYYTDDYGVGLYHASKLAQGANHTGKDLFNSKLTLAWNIVLSDILLDGFQFDKVIEDISTSFNDGYNTETSVSINNGYEYASTYINYLIFKVTGTGTLNVSINGVDVFNDTVSNEDIRIDINANIEDETTISITHNGTIQLTDADGNPFLISGYIKCNKEKYLCRYADVLALAVLSKLCALILNEYLLNSRYNDVKAYSNEENQLAIKLSQLDNTFNLLPLEQLPNRKGMYQRELEKISKIIKPLMCDICFECEGAVKFEYVKL